MQKGVLGILIKIKQVWEKKYFKTVSKWGWDLIKIKTI